MLIILLRELAEVLEFSGYAPLITQTAGTGAERSEGEEWYL